MQNLLKKEKLFTIEYTTKKEKKISAELICLQQVCM